MKNFTKILRITLPIVCIFALTALFLTSCPNPAGGGGGGGSSGGGGSGTPTVAVTGVFLNKTTIPTAVGEPAQKLYVTIAPANATNKNVTWSSSASSVATVSANGEVTGVSVGTATITVTTADGGKTADCTVTVSAAHVPVTNISLKSSTTIGIGIGSEEFFTPTITPNNATNQNLTWTSNNLSIATVTQDGIVTGVNKGSAIITVTTEDGTIKTTCNVNVDLIFTTIPAFKEWIDRQPANTAATAYNVKVKINDLGGESSTSGSLGNALYTNKTKYVNLDLSGSTFTGMKSAFSSCSGLTNITIPNSVTGTTYSFSGCSNLTNVTFEAPSKVKTIGIMAFLFCDSLTNITIPDSVTRIEAYAFENCTSLTSVTIGNSVTYIGDYAINGCNSLTSVIIGNSVTYIGDYVFSGCTSLIEIKVDNANTAYISDNGVLYNKNKTALITYPAKKPGTNFTIPDSVTTIEKSAFNYSNHLTSITIPDSVTRIEASAFGSCTNLISVTIGKNVTWIDQWAFWNCTNLVSVTFQGTIPSSGFHSDYYGSPRVFFGNLRNKFYQSNSTNGTPGTYTTTAPVGENAVWTRK